MLVLIRHLFFWFGLIAFSGQACASFHKTIWPRWEANNPRSIQAISHEEWDLFLARYVQVNDEGIHLVDYPALTMADRELLQRYIDRLAKIDIQNYNRREQLAYWLNLYNALTVQIIAAHYPISSVSDINVSPGLFSVGPWGANLVTVNHAMLSLDDIHNRIIRPIWNDARTHYAINNGAVGAPNLARQAFQGETIEAQLNAAAVTYVNSLRGVHIAEGKLFVSKLYEWFAEDFNYDPQEVIRHLSLFADPQLREALNPMQRISGYIYNWHLNTTIPQVH